MTRRTHATMLVALLAAMLMATACIELTRVSEPSSTSDVIRSLSTGLWSSNGGINPDACGNFKWEITELTGTTAKGTFGATCSGNVKLTGSAEGTLTGTVVNWKAWGVAQTPLGDCTFTITGTAALEGAGVRVNYTANTCVGTFSGSELLKK